VMIGWVFFRADDFGYATEFIGAMFHSRGDALFDSQALSLLSLNWLQFAVAIIVAAPIYPNLRKLQFGKSVTKVLAAAALLLHFFLFAEVVLYLINSTYNPFLYFRF